MQKYRKWITVMCVLFMMLGSTSAVFGKSQIVKTYDFHPKTASNLTYDAPKTITEDGKKYELTDVSYKINKKKTIEKVQTITTRSKDDYPKTLTETISGKEVTLKATGDVDWKEVRSEGVIRTQEYKRQRDIPKTIKSTRTDADGNQMDITLELTDTENASRTEKFSAPAKFYSPSPDGKLYMFNGKRVQIDGSTPTWSGYAADVKSYLGVNGNNYQITGGSWTGQAVKQGDRYVRTASFSGTKQVPLFRATYQETADTTLQYQADVTYTYLTATATATYEPVINIAKIIAVGAGIAILIAAIIALLVLLAKRRKRKEESE